MTEILLIVFELVCVLALCFMFYIIVKQFERQRADWEEIESKLLDRIQAGSLQEYKIHERADVPKIKKELTPEEKEALRKKRLPWA